MSPEINIVRYRDNFQTYVSEIRHSNKRSLEEIDTQFLQLVKIQHYDESDNINEINNVISEVSQNFTILREENQTFLPKTFVEEDIK